LRCSFRSTGRDSATSLAPDVSNKPAATIDNRICPMLPDAWVGRRGSGDSEENKLGGMRRGAGLRCSGGRMATSRDRAAEIWGWGWVDPGARSQRQPDISHWIPFVVEAALSGLNHEGSWMAHTRRSIRKGEQRQ
jgi:hypothetical protein